MSEESHNHEHDHEPVCPLTLAPVGQDLRLCQLCKGRKMARRLAELGLTPGVCLRVVQDAGGPLLVSVRNSRVALGRGIADKLLEQIMPQDETSEPVAEYCPLAHDEAEPVKSRWRGWRHSGSRNSGRRDHWSQG